MLCNECVYNNMLGVRSIPSTHRTLNDARTLNNHMVCGQHTKYNVQIFVSFLHRILRNYILFAEYVQSSSVVQSTMS